MGNIADHPQPPRWPCVFPECENSNCRVVFQVPKEYIHLGIGHMKCYYEPDEDQQEDHATESTEYHRCFTHLVAL